ncbi:hypothetical protein BU23DRAFT_566423 [Bimuria novae-zelandiae CBS 107.79]|uniref:Uncharacterized protein n=1 Tax=Bimuria novae-zelandiae CBS 107.79 TaxID=1447943 RepID=A0A6A5VL74_9PLEO|nr:hypothetical protein BU23DRAFT_566423 [Bimuria novae-zelandiae CBS 107.79]
MGSERTGRSTTRSDRWRMHHLSRFASTDPSTPYPYDITWYECWVRHQVESQPGEVYSIIQQAEADKGDASPNHFANIWHEVWMQASSRNFSIDHAIIHLEK